MSTYMVPEADHSYETDDDLASLPSESTTDTDLETLSDYSESDAEAEWRESIEQLELLLSMVLVPFVGKYFGRRCAYWSMLPYLLIEIRFSYLYIILQVGPGSCNGSTRSRL
jgi:hypothetical protein